MVILAYFRVSTVVVFVALVTDSTYVKATGVHPALPRSHHVFHWKGKVATNQIETNMAKCAEREIHFYIDQCWSIPGVTCHLLFTAELLPVSSRSIRVPQSQGLAAVYGYYFMHWACWAVGVTGCNGWGLVMCGEITSSSTFAAPQVSISAEIPLLGRIQTLILSTVFISYS